MHSLLSPLGAKLRIRKTTSQLELIGSPRREARTPQLGGGQYTEMGLSAPPGSWCTGIEPSGPTGHRAFHLCLSVHPWKLSERQWWCGWVGTASPLRQHLVPREQDLVGFSIRGPQCTRGGAREDHRSQGVWGVPAGVSTSWKFTRVLLGSRAQWSLLCPRQIHSLGGHSGRRSSRETQGRCRTWGFVKPLVLLAIS